MIRILTLAGGLAGAATLSQFPEFSQQYLQRLSGAVDELKVIAMAVDASAAASGITREAALAELDGSAFQSDLRETLGRQIARHDRLAADRAALEAATPLGRLAQLYRFRDPDLAGRTWEAFRPAMPLTRDGVICSGIGFLVGWAFVGALLWAVARPFRSRAQA